jgi:Zn finger protein HypA/HybF involved in hydrogenase expression
MIIEKQASDLDSGDTEVAHKIEIYCGNCDRDVTEAELEAGVCDDCGASLTDAKQCVEIHATSIPMIGITF